MKDVRNYIDCCLSDFYERDQRDILLELPELAGKQNAPLVLRLDRTDSIKDKAPYCPIARSHMKPELTARAIDHLNRGREFPEGTWFDLFMKGDYHYLAKRLEKQLSVPKFTI